MSVDIANDQRSRVQGSPKKKPPRDSVPQTAQHKGENVSDARDPKLPAAIRPSHSRQLGRNEQVAAQELRERDMPALPKDDNVPRSQGPVEVLGRWNT